jgi:glucosamine kinase
VVATLEGRELARVEGGAGIVIPGAEHRTHEVLSELIARALEGAGVAPPVTALVAGLAGVGGEPERRTMEALLAGRARTTPGAGAPLAARIQIRTDAEIAFFDAFGDGPGALLIGGTGSVAMARLPSGIWLRTGGWGAEFGDEGSGWSLGVGAIRRAILGMEGRGARTLLSARVPDVFGVADLEGLLPRVRRAPKGEVAALAPVVLRAAAEGDRVAEELLSETLDGLLGHLTPLVRAWHEQAPGTSLPLALLGGLVKPGGGLRSRLERRLQGLPVALRPAPPDPARGAVAMALRVDALPLSK